MSSTTEQLDAAEAVSHAIKEVFNALHGVGHCRESLHTEPAGSALGHLGSMGAALGASDVDPLPLIRSAREAAEFHARAVASTPKPDMVTTTALDAVELVARAVLDFWEAFHGEKEREIRQAIASGSDLACLIDGLNIRGRA